MLRHLHIQNYALISRLDIDFEEGFSVLTGETGAGKSKPHLMYKGTMYNVQRTMDNVQRTMDNRQRR